MEKLQQSDLVCGGNVEKEKQGGIACMIMEIISILLGIILLMTTGYGYSGNGFGLDLSRLRHLLDIPSLVIMLVFTVPVLLKSGVWRDFKRAWRLLKKDYTCHLSELRRTLDVVEMMQKQVIYAGVICMLLSFVTILGLLSDLASLGPMMAVAILTMLYAVIFEMLLLPLQLEVKRRIIDYMETDTEVESEAAKNWGGTVAGAAVENQSRTAANEAMENDGGAKADAGDDQV